MTATVLLPPILMFADEEGKPLAGGKLYTYEAGTTTPQPLYTDVLRTVPFSNPIILDAAGTPGQPAYPANTSYKVVVTDKNDVQVVFADNIATAASV